MHHSPTEETSALKDLSNIVCHFCHPDISRELIAVQSLHTLDEAAAQVSSDHIPTLLQNAPLALVVPSCFLLEEWENGSSFSSHLQHH